MTTNPSPTDSPLEDPSAASVLEQVRDYYATAARQVTSAGPDQCNTEAECCAATDIVDDARFGRSQYDTGYKDELSAGAVTASMGCGNPVAVADLHAGETVLDLGSGGGIDMLLSARRVGPHGFAYGLDMTEEMLDLARRNAAGAGVTNMEFLKGRLLRRMLASPHTNHSVWPTRTGDLANGASHRITWRRPHTSPSRFRSAFASTAQTRVAEGPVFLLMG